MKDLGSICTHGTRYTKTRTSLWYIKAPLIQTINESVTEMLQANIDRMSLVDRLDFLEDWTRCLAKGHMNFDMKPNALDKELTSKVFSKPISSTLQASLIYRKHGDFFLATWLGKELQPRLPTCQIVPKEAISPLDCHRLSIDSFGASTIKRTLTRFSCDSTRSLLTYSTCLSSYLATCFVKHYLFFACKSRLDFV